MNIVIGKHRLREHTASYVLEYLQASKDGTERWRELIYPTDLAYGFERLFEEEVKSRSKSCTELREFIPLLRALVQEVRACAQLTGIANGTFAPPSVMAA